MTITFSLCPSTSDIDFLTQQINQETPDLGPAYPFAFFIKNPQGSIMAGCNGSVVFGSIYTDQLWVHPDHRKAGLGTQLMNAVHAYGLKVGCSMATVATLSFQKAVSFYEKLGYKTDFQRPGYVHNAFCFFMKKDLW